MSYIIYILISSEILFSLPSDTVQSRNLWLNTLAGSLSAPLIHAMAPYSGGPLLFINQQPRPVQPPVDYRNVLYNRPMDVEFGNNRFTADGDRFSHQCLYPTPPPENGSVSSIPSPYSSEPLSVGDSTGRRSVFSPQQLPPSNFHAPTPTIEEPIDLKYWPCKETNEFVPSPSDFSFDETVKDRQIPSDLRIFSGNLQAIKEDVVEQPTSLVQTDEIDPIAVTVIFSFFFDASC